MAFGSNRARSGFNKNNLQIFKGSTLGQCHKVEAFLGEGGFGFVTKCRNIETGELEAIKVNKNRPDIFSQARQEIAILKQLQRLDPDTCNIVKWNGFFFNRDNICLKFELLDQSLFNYMRGRNHQGLPLTELRPIIHQLATTLSHLSSIGVVHADLKPDNIMVVDSQQHPLKVKVIDFGLASPVAEVQPGACVQTLCWRAPEVLIQAPFNEAIDMWTLGLIAAELATGYMLYSGYTDYDVLRYIIETQGQPADHVLDRGMGTQYYFQKQNGQQRWRFNTPEEFQYETGICSEETRDIIIKSLDDLEQLMVADNGQQSEKRLLVDLIKRMLHLDPDQRIKPLEVLQHPFFTQSLPQDSHPDICTMIDKTDKETPETTQLSSQNQTARPVNIPCRIASKTDVLDAEAGNAEQVDIQPETNAENGSWLRRLVKGITDTFHYYFPRYG